MRAGGQQQKGAKFEREVCERLSRWVDPKGTDTHFWRTASSGGRATRFRKQGRNLHSQLGDISAVNEPGFLFASKIMVECKHVKSLDLDSALIKGKGVLAGFWEKLYQDAKRAYKAPLLIAKQNMWPVIAIMQKRDAMQYFSEHRPPAWVGPLMQGYFVALDAEVYLLDELLRHAYAPDRYR